MTSTTTSAPQGAVPADRLPAPDRTGAAEAFPRERGRFDALRAVAGLAGSWFGRVWGVVWEALGPALRIVTVLGWIVLGAGAVLLTTGLVFGWTEFVVLGAVLVLVFLAALPFAFGRAEYEVEVELSPRRVTVGDRALGRLVVRNTAERRSVPTRMELPVGNGRADFGIPSLQPGEPTEELFAVPTSRRAVIPTGPARSVRGDQLGLVRRSVRWTGVIDLFVHPRTVRLEPSAAGILRDLEGVTTTKITDHDLAFHALRPYEPGDDRRHIHWKTSAKTGTLMVRQFEETRRSQLTVVLTLDRAAYASAAEFELAIEVFASIVQQVLREDLDIDAVTEGGVVPTRTRVAMLDATSRFEPIDARHDSTRAFVAGATRGLRAPTVVLLIGGSLLDARGLRQVKQLYPHEVSMTAFRCETGGRVARTTVRDLTLCTVTVLDDLARLIRQKGMV